MKDKTINININAPGKHVVRVAGFWNPLGLKPGTQLTKRQVETLERMIAKAQSDIKDAVENGKPIALSGSLEFVPTHIVVESE